MECFKTIRNHCKIFITFVFQIHSKSNCVPKMRKITNQLLVNVNFFVIQHDIYGRNA